MVPLNNKRVASGTKRGSVLSSCISVAVVWLVFASNAVALQKVQTFAVESFPKSLDTQCRDGSAKLYDECGSQADILKTAVEKAAQTGKTALVVYGAEWCVWCFVFDAYTKGHYREHYYAWERDPKSDKWVMEKKSNEGAYAEANRLNQFVADHFVIAHIEGDHSPDGASAIDSLGLSAADINFYPFIASLTNKGVYASHLFGYEVMKVDEKRKNKDGQTLKSFDRSLLLNRLQMLRQAALELPVNKK